VGVAGLSADGVGLRLRVDVEGRIRNAAARIIPVAIPILAPSGGALWGPENELYRVRISVAPFPSGAEFRRIIRSCSADGVPPGTSSRGKMCAGVVRMAMRSRYLSGARILPHPWGRDAGVGVDREDVPRPTTGEAAGGRAAPFRTDAEADVTVGLSLTGALTPADSAVSCIVPLLKAGFVDWVVSTGRTCTTTPTSASGSRCTPAPPFLDDRVLRDEGSWEIYDVLFDYEVLLDTDAFFRQVLDLPSSRRRWGRAEFHYRLGRYMAERERPSAGRGERAGGRVAVRGPRLHVVPGRFLDRMNVAAMRLAARGHVRRLPRRERDGGDRLRRETPGGKSAVWILGGGSPKNFMLQTEPQIQEVLGLDEKGHDYFLQITDARPDTGGLSGATPSEAVSWGKVDPDKLPDTVVCYLDSTVALPLLCAFAFDRVGKRTRRRLYDRRAEMLAVLGKAYRKAVNAAGVTKKRKVARKR